MTTQYYYTRAVHPDIASKVVMPLDAKLKGTATWATYACLAINYAFVLTFYFFPWTWFGLAAGFYVHFLFIFAVIVSSLVLVAYLTMVFNEGFRLKVFDRAVGDVFIYKTGFSETPRRLAPPSISEILFLGMVVFLPGGLMIAGLVSWIIQVAIRHVIWRYLSHRYLDLLEK